MKAASSSSRTPYERVGSTDCGVPVLAGRWTQPPLWYCWSTLLFAANLVLQGGIVAVELHRGRPDGWNVVPALFQPTRWILAVAMRGLGAALIWRSAWLFRVRRQLRRLTPADELAAQFGTNGETLERVARQSQIQPAYRVNGVDYYDRADFADASTLLRPAEAPEPALLRSAGSSQDEAAERLLRATNGTEEQW